MARSPQEDDRDFRDERPPQSGGGNTAVKIVAIIAGTVLFVFVACTGLVFLGCYTLKKGVERVGETIEQAQADMEKRQAELEKSDKRHSAKFAESFLQELKDLRYDAAYQKTSEAYRKGTSRKDFEAFVAKNQEALTGFGSLSEDAFAPDMGTTFVVTKVAHVTGGFKDVTITVVKDGNGWKVDKIGVASK
jgi:hypothetical protein